MGRRRYLIFDTNVWIYLCNGYDIFTGKYDLVKLKIYFKILDALIERVKKGDIEILVNDLIIKEWERNKASSFIHITKIQDKLYQIKVVLDSVNEIIVGEENAIKRIKEKLEVQVEIINDLNKKHIEKVENLLYNNTTKIDISNEVRIAATYLAEDKKAPFKGDKKNSMNDALIFLSSIEHIEKNLIVYSPFNIPEEIDFDSSEGSKDNIPLFPKSFFISNNKGDFSNPEKIHEIHPDLKEYLNKTNTIYSINFVQILNEIEENLITEEEVSKLVGDDDFECACQHCGPFGIVQFSNPFFIIDENKPGFDKNQLVIPFGDLEIQFNETDSMASIRTGECNYCLTNHIICPNCDEITAWVEFGVPIECRGDCNTVFIVDKSFTNDEGSEYTYRIIQKIEICESCGAEFIDDMRNTNVCDACDMKYSIH